MHHTCGVLWIIELHKDIALDTRQRDMSSYFWILFFSLQISMCDGVSHMREASSRNAVAIVIVGLGYHRSKPQGVPYLDPRPSLSTHVQGTKAVVIDGLTRWARNLPWLTNTREKSPKTICEPCPGARGVCRFDNTLQHVQHHSVKLLIEA